MFIAFASSKAKILSCLVIVLLQAAYYKSVFFSSFNDCVFLVFPQEKKRPTFSEKSEKADETNKHAKVERERESDGTIVGFFFGKGHRSLTLTSSDNEL